MHAESKSDRAGNLEDGAVTERGEGMMAWMIDSQNRTVIYKIHEQTKGPYLEAEVSVRASDSEKAKELAKKIAMFLNETERK